VPAETKGTINPIAEEDEAAHLGLQNQLSIPEDPNVINNHNSFAELESMYQDINHDDVGTGGDIIVEETDDYNDHEEPDY